MKLYRYKLSHPSCCAATDDPRYFRISPIFTLPCPISTIAVWPGGDNIRMIGTQNGQVWATSTGASALVNITSGSFPTNPNGSTSNKFVGRAVIDPNNKNVAYVAFSFFAPAGQGVWKIGDDALTRPGAWLRRKWSGRSWFTVAKGVNEDVLAVRTVSTTTFTPGLPDVGKLIELTSDSAIVVTAPSETTAAFPIGTRIEFHRYGAGQVRFAAEVGVTLNAPARACGIAFRYGTAFLRKRSIDEWQLSGDIMESS